MTKIITGGEFENLAQEIANQAVEENVFQDEKTLIGSKIPAKTHEFVNAKLAKFFAKKENKDKKIPDNFKNDVVKEIIFSAMGARNKLAKEIAEKETAARREYEESVRNAKEKLLADKEKIKNGE